MNRDSENRVTISVIVHTKNEENDIARCLKSAAWADEIVVIDMASTDRTVEMARNFTSNIHPCPDYGYVEPARNLGLSKATGDWIFILDADEEIPENLAADIQKIIKASPGYALIALPRQNYIGDYRIKDSGWGADYQPRLFKRGRVNWQPAVHSWPVVDGEIKYLDPGEGYFIKHYNFADLAEFVTRSNTYTGFEAGKILDSGKKSGWRDILQECAKEFNSRYTPREDGMHSLLLAGCMAFYKFLSYGKALERRYNEDKNFQFEVPEDILSAVSGEMTASTEESRRRVNEVSRWAQSLQGELELEKDRFRDLHSIKMSPQFRLGLALGRFGSSLRRPFETAHRLFSKTRRLTVKNGLGYSEDIRGVGFLQGSFRPRRGEFMPKLSIRAGNKNWECTVEPLGDDATSVVRNEYRFSCAFLTGDKTQILRLLQVRPHLRTKQVITSCIIPGPKNGWMTKLLKSGPGETHQLAFPAATEPVVSIIVPLRRDLSRVLRCLASVLACSTKVEYEVIACDTGDHDQTMSVLGSIPGIRIAKSSGQNTFAESCTHAARIARGKYLLFLSDNAQVSQHGLQCLLDLFGRMPSANAIVWKNMPPPSMPQQPEQADDIVMIERGLFERLGGFDQKYEPENFEITDFAMHVWSSGARAYFVEGRADRWLPLDFKGPDAYRLSFQAKENPLVSIVIPTHNQIGYTLRCLASIQAHTRGIDYEVIVGDDRSTDDFRTILNSIHGVQTTLNSGTPGFVANCNQAARLAKGKYLLFLNNDTEVRPDWLQPLLEVFDHFPDAGAVGSKLIYPDGRLQEAGSIIWNDASGWNYGKNDSADKPEYNYIRETDYCSAASLLVDRALFEQVGGFGAEYEPAYYEDVDLAFKIRAAGYKVYYQPKSAVVHHEGKSCGTDTDTGMKASQVTNRAKFQSKWKAELTNHSGEEGIFRSRERSRGKKLAIFIDHYVPMIDKDAGSRSTFHYVKLFVDAGMSVKFVGDNFTAHQPYTEMLQQMGVEVIYGDWYRHHIHEWLRANANDIDVIFTIRSHITNKYLETFKELKKARILYYGIDIASIRLQRQAQLTGSREAAEEAAIEERLEMKIWQDVDAVYYPSTEEAVYVHSKLPQIASRAIPLNICEPFDEDYAGTLDQRRDIMFVGGFQHPPNEDGVLWFLDECWPSIKEELPGCKFYIVGSNPPETVRRRASNDVIVTGWISDADLGDLYQRVRLIVAPLRYGGGVKGKVVEAVRHHIPPIITPMAAEGLPGIENCTSIRETTREDFAKTVASLYKDTARLRDLSAKCGDYIRQNFSPAVAREIIANDLPWLKSDSAVQKNNVQ